MGRDSWDREVLRLGILFPAWQGGHPGDLHRYRPTDVHSPSSSPQYCYLRLVAWLLYCEKGQESRTLLLLTISSGPASLFIRLSAVLINQKENTLSVILLPRLTFPSHREPQSPPAGAFLLIIWECPVRIFISLTTVSNSSNTILCWNYLTRFHPKTAGPHQPMKGFAKYWLSSVGGRHLGSSC